MYLRIPNINISKIEIFIHLQVFEDLSR